MKNITLKEAYNKRNVQKLKDMASAYKVKGYTKMNKEQLIDACVKAVQDEDIFVEHAFILPPETWKFYKQVAESNHGLKCKAASIEYEISEILGFLHSEKCEEGYWFVVPDEIKKIYHELIKSGFSEVKEFADLVHQYAQAAVNLYGIIHQEELVEIFNAQNEHQTDVDINFGLYMKHICFDSDYCLWEEYVVHEDLEEDDFESAKDLIRDTADKPRYIPEKKEFLRYADWHYYENTKQLVNLSNFLINKCGVFNADINELMFDLHWEFSEGNSIQNYFDILETHHVIVKENQLDELVSLMIDCSNNTRIWFNKGYTPVELAKFYRTPQTKSHKIGRNAPCPCGSGKKYKQCCGK